MWLQQPESRYQGVLDLPGLTDRAVEVWARTRWTMTSRSAADRLAVEKRASMDEEDSMADESGDDTTPA
ncbi:hypothetical protein L484_007842 [Morus notabilis]|uniref:Uncharacterized protein n=1 Tax=Morus notabilis TaxID=981085 RepID=W9S748_9ROSA|nr:hypothetical protein L484_007842 [Morus notabilis]